MSVIVKDLCFSYGARPVLENISFALAGGQLVSLLGPNGVGKSTLFKCMLGLMSKYTGTIEIDGKSIAGMDMRSLARLIAYIPQAHYPAFNYTVFDMVLMGTTSQVPVFASPGDAQREAAAQALERLGIGEFAQRDFMRISGGERQLVLIARALAQQSRILVMDEPTANLDYGNQMRVLSRIRSLAEEGYTIIQSTHNPEQSYLFSHQILAMQHGKIIAQGDPKDVLNAELISALYNIDAQVESLHDDKMRVCIPNKLVI